MRMTIRRLRNNDGSDCRNPRAVPADVDVDYSGRLLAFAPTESRSVIMEIVGVRLLSISADGMRVSGYERYFHRGKEAYRTMDLYMTPFIEEKEAP